MPHTRGVVFLFLALWTLFTHLVVSTPPKWIDTLPTFLTANKLQEMDVNNKTGDVFVGGRNVLYHLSADLELKQNVSTGPLKDYPGCFIPPYPCSGARVSTDNDVRFLKVYYFGETPSLLLCGTVYNNLCQVRPIHNLEEFHWVQPYNESLGFATNQNLNYALFAPGYNGRSTLFIAAIDVAKYRTQNSAPYLSSRLLMKEGDRYYFQYPLQMDPTTFDPFEMEQTSFDPFEMQPMSRSLTIKGVSSRFPVDGGFVYRDFIYFPVLYSLRFSIVESRLVRFCTTDATFRSYAELPIQCNFKGKIMKRQMAAHLGESRISTEEALYVSFNDDSSGSALCVFEMSSVVEAFTTHPRNCNREIVGETCDHEEGKQFVDFDAPDDPPYIVTQPLEVEYFAFVPAIVITAVTTVRQYFEIVAIAGANNGIVVKLSLSTGHVLSDKDALNATTITPFVSPFVFDLQHTHIYLLSKYKVIKYPFASCGAHETCQECFTRGKTDPLKCGWCAGGRCSHLAECADPNSFSLDTCTPSLYEVFPQKGPVQGGNTIKITGDSLGSYVDDAHNSISVAGIPCKVSFWNNTQVNCTIGLTPKEISGPIQLNVINTFNSTLGYSIAGSTISQSNFSYYVGPRLYGIRPSKGPTSGGTIVTLFGEDLDFDKDKKRFIRVSGRLCDLKRFDNYTVSCITQNTSSTKFIKETGIHIDGVAYIMDKYPPSAFNLTGLSQTFEYTPDPYVNDIRPGITTVSGLMNLTVIGGNLDSVRFPKMVVKIDRNHFSGDPEFIEECWIDPKSKGTHMECRTPSLKSAMIFPAPTRTHPFAVEVSFIMDGVQKLREFSKHRYDLSRLLYYPDPEFTNFQETEKIKKDQKVLEIKGNYLDLMNAVGNMQVRIGQEESCKITIVSSDILLCDLPPSISLNLSLSRSNISVEVITGSMIHHLGYIELEQQNEWNSPFGVLDILLVIGVIVISLVAIFLGYKYRLRCRRKLLHNINSVALANRDKDSHDYRAVPTRAVAASSSSEYPALCAIAESPGAESPGAKMPLMDNDTLFLLADKDLIISKEFLVMGEQIGAGQFGCVFEGYLKLPNQTESIKVAVKTLQEHTWNNPATVQTFLKEALIMKDFNHPNVLSLLGVCFEGSGPSIVLPYMENKDLHSYIINENRVLYVADLLKFAVDVTSGMSYLEEYKFIHRDLAARNCFLDSSLNAKVADFGLSRDIYVDNYYCQENKGKIPYKWTAPESLEKKLFSTKSDVWSCGVLLWELLTRGSIPYCNIDNYDLLKYIKQGRRLDQPECCPLPLYYVMLACWNINYNSRPTFYELHNYIRRIREILLENRQAEALPAAEAVPAQHTVYYNSGEHYLNMEGRILNEGILQEF